jgi:hypothetical protein
MLGISAALHNFFGLWNTPPVEGLGRTTKDMQFVISNECEKSFLDRWPQFLDNPFSYRIDEKEPRTLQFT